MRPISSWGRLSADLHEVLELQEPNKIAKQLAEKLPGIPYGMGRSYGDVCLNPAGRLWQTSKLDHFIHFDEYTGCLICEPGVLLGDIQTLMIPRGWGLAVSPGTQFVTVGGAIANDVHGKNQHLLGSFGDHVLAISLLRTNGEVIQCGPDLETDYFAATVGGLGLTGLIVEVALQLRRVPGPWLSTETLPYKNLAEFFQLASSSEENWEHTVSWVDCSSGVKGRGLFMRANTIAIENLPEPKIFRRTMPILPPFSLINKISLPIFNKLYFNIKKWQAGPVISHYQPFFYPLDKIHRWNKIYGPKGFFQYQSLVPIEHGQESVAAMLGEIARSGEGSFLAVLKTFAKRKSLGMLSFVQPGVTLALDFPNRGAKTIKLLASLDAIVREAGGRLYPAKDARMPRDLFESGYPRLNEFLQYRDPGISSAFSRRLMGS
jgi:FAD/FMN-containing dehydrogenase